MKTIRNNLFILSHVFRAVPLYTSGVIVYNIVRALVVVGDLWICRLVIGWLTSNTMLEDIRSFAVIAAFYGGYILLDYLGNQLNLLIINWYGSIRGLDVSKYMRNLLYQKVKELELSCYENSEFYNDLQRALNEIDLRPIHVVDSLGNSVYHLLTLILITVIILDPVFFLAGIVITVHHILHVKKINRINYEMDRDTQVCMRRGQYVRGLFKNREFIKEARIYRSEDFFIRISESSAEEDYSVSSVYNKKGNRSSVFMILTGHLGNLLISVYVCQQMLVGHYMPGDFVYLLSSFSAFTTNMSSLFQIFSQLQDHSMYIENIRKILDYQSPRVKQMNAFAEEGPWAMEQIALKGASFGYDGSETCAIKDMDVCIRKGEKVALIGENGSGKSTLVKLLLDYYPVQKGEILYNGIPYSYYTQNQLRGKFSVAFQDSQIYALSIAENVLMRELQSDKDERLIMEALTFSGLWEKVSSLEKGIHTIVTKEFDEDGVYFSGGEYQKLIIARAYAHQGEILIFDEPASALDPIAEYELFRKMMQLGSDKTVVYITHRLAATVGADQIYYIENGRVKEQGTHQQLMEKQGRYHRMFSVQMKGYK